MELPFTHRTLMDWAGPRVYHYGKTLFEEGRVRNVEMDLPEVRGELDHGVRGLSCRFRILKNGNVDNKCPCRDSVERGIICSHVVALSMELISQHKDPNRQRQIMEEKRRAKRLEDFSTSDYMNRVGRGTKGAVPATARITLPKNWITAFRAGAVAIRVRIVFKKEEHAPREIDKKMPLAFSKSDLQLLDLLEDISEGPIKGRLQVMQRDFLSILKLCKDSKNILRLNDNFMTVHSDTRESDTAMTLDRETGELILSLNTKLPMDEDLFEEPSYLVTRTEGWVRYQNDIWPLSNLLPYPLHRVYQEPILVDRPSVPRFMQTELPLIRDHIQVKTDITVDLLSLDPADPAFRLVVKGSPASLSGTLFACYKDHELVACKNDAQGQFALPDPDDLLRYTVRNPYAEKRAIEHLAISGFIGEKGHMLSPIVGTREVLNFLGSGLPRLRRLGFRVELEGRIQPFLDNAESAKPVVNVENENKNRWFDVGFKFEDGKGSSIDERDIQKALLKGDSFIEYKGRTFLLDADAIETARKVFADCAAGDGKKAGTFRMGGIYSAYVESSLESLDGVDLESNSQWQHRARSQNRAERIEKVKLSDNMEKTLRSYQKDGVYWLRFLEANGLCGILADEMGLGKTLQALAWIQLERVEEELRKKPALIICPTSLVENWAEEAEKFTPELKICVLSGTERHKRWEQVPDADIVVTSYALIRRDIERYMQQEFAALILDEAQHIKNRSTQNAVAAKKIVCENKLVLTGTPIENSVTDLASIMDFLMPGYLGSQKSFHDNYEMPISKMGPEAEEAQSRLRKKLHPFLLRRLKRDVAKELPPKIERIAYCTLTKDQKLVYKQLLETSRKRIYDMVERDGFNQSRMEILKTLLRLRQTCCHLDLLKLKDIKAKKPSAKMDLFFEYLDEALDAGHRVLVFSQFTTMLGILREEFKKRKMRYCYLDGTTRNRMQVVHEFNREQSIPVFLISLKAGGTGLNLTGADMVVHFDPWWNPAVEDQATDRAYRIGQKRTVYSIKMITKGTVEEKVLDMQRRKKSVIDATLNKDEDQVMQKLTWEDVQDLLHLE